MWGRRGVQIWLWKDVYTQMPSDRLAGFEPAVLAQPDAGLWPNHTIFRAALGRPSCTGSHRVAKKGATDVLHPILVASSLLAEKAAV